MFWASGQRGGHRIMGRDPFGGGVSLTGHHTCWNTLPGIPGGGDFDPTVEIPLEGLRIGQQLAWFERELKEPEKKEMKRQYDLMRFYAALEKLAERVGGKRTMGECDSRQGWPTRGIYFLI